MTQDKSAKEASRLAEKRAREAQAQHTPEQGPREFTSEEILDAHNNNEKGDARLLLAAMQDKFVFDAKRACFFRFENGHWTKDLENESLASAGRILNDVYSLEAARQDKIYNDPISDEETKKTAAFWRDKLNRRRDKINSLHRQQNVLKLAASGLDGLIITGDEWNRDPWSIQARDLLIDLKTGEARPGLPGDFINKSAKAEWKGLHEPAQCWHESLLSIFNLDETLTSYVLRLLGAALVGNPGQQEFYIFWGEGRNGKGTILETLKEVLGEGLAGPIKSEMIMDARMFGSNGANPELLDLQGKRIVWASETKEGQKLNSEKVKLFSGGDSLSGRLNYSNEIVSFRPTHTLFMLTNHKPRIAPGDTALWDRLRLIPFLVRFVNNPSRANERPKNIRLQEKLLQEASGILASLVRGCLEYQREGLNPPEIVTEFGKEYLLDEDPVQQFINAQCYTGTGYKAQAKPLYEAFAEWFIETYGAKTTVPSLKRFSDRLRRTYRREDGRNVWFHGIALRADDE